MSVSLSVCLYVVHDFIPVFLLFTSLQTETVTRLNDAEQELASTRQELASTREDQASTRQELASTRQDQASTRQELASTRQNQASSHQETKQNMVCFNVFCGSGFYGSVRVHANICVLSLFYFEMALCVCPTILSANVGWGGGGVGGCTRSRFRHGYHW